jgi:hypothetical protein
VSRRIVAAVVGIVLLVALAVVLALGAVDALRWRGAVERDDVTFIASRGRPGLWRVDTLLPRDPVRRALGVRDDLAYRRAVQRFLLGRPNQQARDQHDLAVRAQADFELARVGPAGGSAEARSRAATLRGALAFEEARSSGPRSAAAIQRSLEQFREAIGLDASNEQAKYDLELVLRLIRSSDEGGSRQGRRGPRPNGSPGSGAGQSSNQSGF